MTHPTPTPAPSQPSTADLLAMLPAGPRAAFAGLMLLMAVGAPVGSYVAAGQASAADQAVLAAKVERVQEDVSDLGAKVDRIYELVLKGDR